METRSRDKEFQRLKAEAKELGLCGKEISDCIKEVRRQIELEEQQKQKAEFELKQQEAKQKTEAELELKRLEFEDEQKREARQLDETRLPLEADEREKAAFRAHELEGHDCNRVPM